jgi:hypothetical protein
MNAHTKIHELQGTPVTAVMLSKIGQFLDKDMRFIMQPNEDNVLCFSFEVKHGGKWKAFSLRNDAFLNPNTESLATPAWTIPDSGTEDKKYLTKERRQKARLALKKKEENDSAYESGIEFAISLEEKPDHREERKYATLNVYILNGVTAYYSGDKLVEYRTADGKTHFPQPKE